MRRPLPLALSLALFASGAAAQTQPASVDALLRQGVALRQRGNDAGALEVFQRARALSPEPRVIAQIALAEQALGRWVDAARDLRAAMQREDDPWIRRNLSALNGAREEIMRHVGGLRAQGDGARGSLRVDGAEVATLPMTEAAVVLSGEREVEVHAPGYVPWRRRVDVRAGELTSLDVPALHPETTVAPSLPVRAAPSNRGRAQRIAGWSLVGASAAGIGVGIYALVARDDAERALANDPRCQGAGTPPAVCAERRDTADTMSAVMIAGFVGAGVLALTGTVLVLSAPSSRAPATTLACAPGWRAVGCSLSF